MPKDPAAMLQLAAPVNGLNSPDMKPWHLKATYQTFDDQGNPKDRGTFEEWWAGPQQDKRVYTSPTFTQTEHITADGKFRLGSQDGPPLPEFLVRARIVHPMPDAKDMEGSQLRRIDSPFPKANLNCVELARPMRIEGTVKLGTLIAEDGHIRELRVLEAPDPTLAISALIAVHDWLYQPYLLNGHPVEVETEINVNYRIGG